ncbi:beta-1,3-glucan-binding protein-like [Amphiura filiformis]|uniref:beta-1,3-glucan-binding protein-like n=1 Tax=Amphiura filiformis TaxID=82378 RepID=UPI003B219920
MASIFKLTVVAFFFAVCHAIPPLPPVQFSVMSPQGLRMQILGNPGITLVAYHYSINKDVIGVAPGDYNYDITDKTGDYWVHENTDIVVNSGDVVNYWYLVIYNGGGYQDTDLSWTAVYCFHSHGCISSPDMCYRYPCDAGCDMGVPPCNGLIFEDNFDSLNKNVWEHEITAGGGGNWEFQYYTNNRTNSYCRDGTLFIKPTLTEDTYGKGFVSSGTLNLWGSSPANLCTGHQWWGCERLGNPTNYINPVQSARLRSVHSFGFTYGKVEVRAKMPIGDWLWPAIWLLPTHSGYGEWPASGEIDIVESRGNINYKDSGGTSVGVDQMGSAMHWGPFMPYNAYHLTHASKNLNGQNFGEAFYKYVVEWTPTDISFFVDDEQILKIDPGPNGFYDFGKFATEVPNTHNPWENSPNKMAPFDQDFYIIMNVAVGGTGGYFSDGLTNQPYPKPWNDQSPTAPRDFWLAKDQWYPTWFPTVNNGEGAAMEVDYVRVWAHGSY